MLPLRREPAWHRRAAAPRDSKSCRRRRSRLFVGAGRVWGNLGATRTRSSDGSLNAPKVRWKDLWPTPNRAFLPTRARPRHAPTVTQAARHRQP